MPGDAVAEEGGPGGVTLLGQERETAKRADSSKLGASRKQQLESDDR